MKHLSWILVALVIGAGLMWWIGQSTRGSAVAGPGEEASHAGPTTPAELSAPNVGETRASNVEGARAPSEAPGPPDPPAPTTGPAAASSADDPDVATPVAPSTPPDATEPSVLVGRLLSPTGEALRRTRIEVLVRGGNRNHLTWRWETTDDEAVFRHVVVEPAPFELVELRNLRSPVGPESNRPRIRASIALPATLASGEHDLGTISLELDPILAGGVVVDEAGRPIEGVWLSLGMVRATAGGVLDLADTATLSDEDGSFEIRGRSDERRAILTTRHDRYSITEASRQLELGRDDHRIVMSVAGALELTVLADPGARAGVMVKASRDRGSRATSVSEGDRAVLDGLDPGEYQVTVEVLSGNETVAELGAFAVVGDSVTNVGTLDLRGRLNVMVLRAVDAEGQLLHAQFEMIRPSGERLRLYGGREKGVRRCVTEAASLHVVVSCSGYLAVEREAVQGDETFVLEKK